MVSMEDTLSVSSQGVLGSMGHSRDSGAFTTLAVTGCVEPPGM